MLQRRTTLSNGETAWAASPLLQGIIEGRLVIVDGLQRLAAGTISFLLSLTGERHVVTFDGKRYIDGKR